MACGVVGAGGWVGVACVVVFVWVGGAGVVGVVDVVVVSAGVWYLW